MKKLAIVFAALLITLIFPFNTAVNAQGGEFEYTGVFDIDSFLKDFTETHNDRSSVNYDKERAAALYLANMFLGLNYYTIDNNPAAAKENYLQTFTSGALKSNNVIAIKPAAEATERTVIIGAHYDNVYAYQQTNPYTRLNYSTLSHGAYDNGSGVAVMMSVANDIVDEEFPFNIIFVAFGAEEGGMKGSKFFVDNLSFSQKSNILLMINLDSIAAGDYVYLFCQDWHVEHDSYIRDKANDLNVPLRALPFDKKYTFDPFGEKYYSHYGYYSDNYYFIEEKIPSAFFMSMNWESKIKAGVVESDNRNDIMHTSNDTYAKLKELYPTTYLLHMQYVSEIIRSMLHNEDFAAAMISSRQNAPDYSFITNELYLRVAAFTVWLFFAVFAYIYGGRLKKVSLQSIKEYMENPENAERINAILQGLPKMPPFNNINYPPSTNKVKKSDKDFSVFGKEYDKNEEENLSDSENNNEDKTD